VLIIETDAPAARPLDQLLELRLVEGMLGRLLYVIGAEKQRLRRQARELLTLRQLPFAFAGPISRGIRRTGSDP